MTTHPPLGQKRLPTAVTKTSPKEVWERDSANPMIERLKGTDRVRTIPFPLTNASVPVAKASGLAAWEQDRARERALDEVTKCLVIHGDSIHESTAPKMLVISTPWQSGKSWYEQLVAQAVKDENTASPGHQAWLKGDFAVQHGTICCSKCVGSPSRCFSCRMDELDHQNPAPAAAHREAQAQEARDRKVVKAINEDLMNLKGPGLFSSCYNESLDRTEVWNGEGWRPVGDTVVTLQNSQKVTYVTTTDPAKAPQAGDYRHNDATQSVELFSGSEWVPIQAASTTTPGSTPSADVFSGVATITAHGSQILEKYMEDIIAARVMEEQKQLNRRVNEDLVTLQNIADKMSYNKSTTEAAEKHRLNEIAARLGIYGYGKL